MLERFQIFDQRRLLVLREVGARQMTAVALAWLRGVVEERAVAAQADAVDVERIAAGPECLRPLRRRRRATQDALRKLPRERVVFEQRENRVVDIAVEPLEIGQARSAVDRKHPGCRLPVRVGSRVRELTGMTGGTGQPDVGAIAEAGRSVVDREANGRPWGLAADFSDGMKP